TKREETRQRADIAATVLALYKLRQERRHDGAFRAGADARDQTRAEQKAEGRRAGAQEAADTIERERIHHDLLPAYQIDHGAREECPEQVPDQERTAQQAGLPIAETEQRGYGRKDECQDGAAGGIERVAEPTHKQQPALNP